MNTTERDDLDAFVRRADRLSRCRIYSLDRVSVFELSFKPGQVQAKSTEPDEETLSSFVSVLRPLILPKYGTSLHKILQLCHHNLDDAELLRQLDEVRMAWKTAQKQGPLRLVVNDRDWRPERIAHLIINSQEAHDDHRYRRELAQLGVVETMISRSIYLGYVTQTAAAAQRVAAIIKTGLRDRRFR